MLWEQPNPTWRNAVLAREQEDTDISNHLANEVEGELQG